jgi:DMSO/TMAO reductase YedYZ molybdopterin-dependent catalytic subunit
MMRLRSALGVGLMSTIALMSVLYLGYTAADLPFSPYALFDWIARTLPGDIVITGIDTMVELISKLNLGQTDTTAKLLERLMALGQFLVGGIVATLILFAALRRLKSRGLLPYILGGMVAGFALGVPILLITDYINYRTDTVITQVASETATMIWLAVVFLIWGGGSGWIYYRLYVEFPADVSTEESIIVAHLNRRQFLITMGGVAATLTLIGAGVGSLLRYRYQEDIPEREKDVDTLLDDSRRAAYRQTSTGDLSLEPAPGTRPEYTPLEDHYRIDINIDPPEIDESLWRLQIHGMVDQELSLTLEDLKTNYTPLNQVVTLACISNRVGGDLTSTTLWTGARLRDVLAGAGVQDGATHLKITAADGFYETVNLNELDDDRVMLCYSWDGRPNLLHKHGFPLRIYLPNRYGMKQPKWITDIEVMDHDEDGYWVVRGWDKVAEMRATSVIDTVAEDSPYERSNQVYVPIGGIAHAGARGISTVEVRVDDGDWTEAQLRAPLSETSWVIWRYDWPFAPGDHTFSVRCTETDGMPQITDERSTYPSGATGIYSVEHEF